MKRLMLSAAAAALLAAPGAASAADYTFALVPKNVNNPFFDQARDGCKKAEEELGGAIECRYIGPGEHGGGEEQLQMVNDLIQSGVDGIAVSPSNAAAMASALAQAKAAGIPVLTWDSDLLPENQDLRIAYVGTKNYDIGVNLAKIVAADQAGRRHDLHPVGRRRGRQPQRAHAGHPRHARRHERHHLAGRAADRRERLDRGRRLPAVHRRRLPALGAADGRHARQVPGPRCLHPDRRLPAVRAGRLSQRRDQGEGPDRQQASSPWWSPTPCRCRWT